MEKKVPVLAKKKPTKATIVRNHVDAVKGEYEAAGWMITMPPIQGGVNDIIASNGKRLHFIQVVTPETIDTARHVGVPKSEFIQNALSNSAEPVYAQTTLVQRKKTGGGTDELVYSAKYKNADTDARVVLVKKTSKIPDKKTPKS